MKKIKIYSEIAYLAGLAVLSFAVAMTGAADMGMSMIVAPAYILSLKLGFLSFGQCEYVVQGVLFVIMCLLMKKFKPLFLFSFFSGLIYGTVLDIWRSAIAMFNPALTTPGSMVLGLRLLFFALGIILTGISVAVLFRSYVYPQVYDYFVKAVSRHFGVPTAKFKLFYDFGSLALSVAMSLLLFRGFVGVGFGTLVMACLNGPVIGFFDKLYDKYFEFVPLFPKAEKLFEN